jgi:hypothetical protein
VDELRIILEAGELIAGWFTRHGGNGLGRMRAYLGDTIFRRADWYGRFNNVNHVRGFNVRLLPDGFDVDTVIHELGHVLDNRLGFRWPIGSALFGGGAADRMSRYLGADPRQCGWNRSAGCTVEGERGTYYTPVQAPPTDYAWNGPSEDFAESFRLSVRGTLTGARAFWFLGFDSLTLTKPEYTGNPYYDRRRIVAGPIPTVPIGSGGGGMRWDTPVFR